ncbi:type 4b pilus protein PilO2 [Pseudomonas aeruginosa]|nr:type 4b pilus protein PilO2 [Pseudomonas aeruginosa]
MEKPDLGSRGPDVSILSYHGNKFVSGLFWRPLSSQRQYMKEARKLGKEEHLDIVAIRHSPTVIQAGFVSKSQGAVKGMYSLASALSGQFDGDFLACWKVDEDRYALVATLDGAIVPGQDLVTTSTRPGTGSEALYARRAAKRTGLRSRRVRFPRQGLRHRGTARAEAPAARLPPPATHLRLVRQGVDGSGPARLRGRWVANRLLPMECPPGRARQASRAPRGAEAPRRAGREERPGQAAAGPGVIAEALDAHT